MDERDRAKACKVAQTRAEILGSPGHFEPPKLSCFYNVKMSKTPIRVLVTGFSVFPGAPANPTAWVIDTLLRDKWHPKGAQIFARTLPVRFDLWEREMEPLLAEVRPDIVVAFGLSAKATGVTLESTAHNIVAIDRPDHTGACAARACVIDDGPKHYATALPLARIETALRNAKIPVSPSDSAGDYLCNLTFYRLMALAAQGGPQMAGFIHVPCLDTQVARLAAAGHNVPHASTLTEAQLIAAVKIVVETCVGVLQQSSRVIA
jgi:pyroglutamyl-peptidase